MDIDTRQWEGILCDNCLPRATYGDGRICRACAARLGQVKPDTLSSWVTRGYLSNVRYEGRRPWYWPAEVISAAFELHGRERARLNFLSSLQPDFEGSVTR